MDDSFAARVDRLLAEVALDTDIDFTHDTDTSFTPMGGRLVDPPPGAGWDWPARPETERTEVPSAGLSTNAYPTPAADNAPTPAQEARTSTSIYASGAAAQGASQEEITHVVDVSGQPHGRGSTTQGKSDAPAAEQLRWSTIGRDEAFSFEHSKSVEKLGQGVPTRKERSSTEEYLTSDEQVIKLLNNLEQEVDLASRSRTPMKFDAIGGDMELTGWQIDNLSPRPKSVGRQRPVSAPPKKPGNQRQQPGLRLDSSTPGRSVSASRPAPSLMRTGHSPPVLHTAMRRKSPPGRGKAGSSPPRAGRNNASLAEEIAAGKASAKKKSGTDSSKLQATIQAQELRLKGQTETIRALERTVKAKETALKLLEEEMKSRSEAVHSAQAAAIMVSATAKRLGDETSKSAALMAARKRSDELSTRCSQLESQVKDMKKTEKTSRERGNSLISKLKESEDMRYRLTEELSKRKKVGTAAAATIKTLHKQVKSMEREVTEKQEMAEKMLDLRKQLAEMRAVKKSNSELQEENGFLKTEVSRLSAACHKSETHAQEAEKSLAGLRLEVSDLQARVAEANENVRLGNEEKSKMERHSRVMESTCERLRDQLKEHTERARRELADARWQKAKEKAREATRASGNRGGLVCDSDEESELPLPRRPLSASRERPGASVESLDYYRPRLESSSAGAVGSDSRAAEVAGAYHGDSPGAEPTPSGDVAGGSGGPQPEAPLSFRVPHTTDGTSANSDAEPGGSFVFSQAKSVREQIAKRSPRQSPGEDLPGSASKRLAELRARYSLLKDKLNQ